MKEIVIAQKAKFVENFDNSTLQSKPWKSFQIKGALNLPCQNIISKSPEKFWIYHLFLNQIID